MPSKQAAETASQFIYGLHTVRAAISRNPELITQLLIQQGNRAQRLGPLVQQARQANISVTEVNRAQLDNICQARPHQGVLAYTLEAEALGEQSLEALLEKAGSNPLVLVLDGVQDPHNLGACLRTADAAGVDFVMIPKDKSAPLSATARKVACGAAETMPLLRVTNLARNLRKLKAAGLWLWGSDPEAELSIYQGQLTGPLAMVLGAEGKGLRHLTKALCDHLSHIPMSGSVSSVNVSVATGICLFEARRQRDDHRANKSN